MSTPTPDLNPYTTHFARAMLEQGHCPKCSNSPGYHDKAASDCDLTPDQVTALAEAFRADPGNKVGDA